MAHVEKATFHDIRKTTITDWLRQGLSEYDLMTLGVPANFATTHRFYLAVTNDLINRASKATRMFQKIIVLSIFTCQSRQKIKPPFGSFLKVRQETLCESHFQAIRKISLDDNQDRVRLSPADQYSKIAESTKRFYHCQ